MKEHTRSRVTGVRRQYRRLPHDKTLVHVPLRAADARRSVQNILDWNGYLPANCVRTMVRMGWDYTT